MFVKKLTQTGDTIIEVMIVVVVLASVLAGGYAVAVSSLQSVQLTQERGYALKLAEGQLEKLKGYQGTLPIVATGDGFCFDSSGTVQAITGSRPTTNLDEVTTNYPTSCTHNPNSNGVACTTGYCYFYGIRYLGGNQYTAAVHWEGPHGNNQQVILTYRIYP